jgi:hypothetical protein
MVMELSDETRKRLLGQLVKLGDMMGEGLHHESDGKWISNEYKKVCKDLGYIQSKPRQTTAINEAIITRLASVRCTKCEGQLKQTRSGSKRAICISCDAKFQVLK